MIVECVELRLVNVAVLFDLAIEPPERLKELGHIGDVDCCAAGDG